MITTLIVTFREVLEAVLIISILYSYVIKTDNQQSLKYIHWGVFAGISASIGGAVFFQVVASGFEGRNEQIFEGIVFLIGAVFITTMILWLMRQERKIHDLEDKLAISLKKSQNIGIIFLVFISILREGIELVVFLTVLNINPEAYAWLGVLIGFIAAIVIGWALYKGAIRFNLKLFFMVTNILLIFFSAGMIAYGIHELIEVGLVNPIIAPVWDINHILDDKSTLGNFLKTLFGYNGNPALIEVLAYIIYLSSVIFIWMKIRINRLK